ncbi:unnamed protein product [Cyclocybe aegerita]|uniref:Uncharacterized protein n=1 Tax=Cyclocybe aegerita TaxID=1973307 RepID=A0A8S0W422_CYCAE|nr:unnamed protein product [Cyclocybe aegerita]
MPNLFSGRKKEKYSQRLGEDVNTALSKASSYRIVEQRIHPDQNSLAEELSASQGHVLHIYDPNTMTAGKHAPRAAAPPSASDFVGLEPSSRRRFPRSEEFGEHNKEPRQGLFWSSSQHLYASCSGKEVYAVQRNHPEVHARDTLFPLALPVHIEPVFQEPPGQEMQPRSISRRATFGRRPDNLISEMTTNTRSSSRSASQSSLGQAGSIITYCSQATADNEPETPGSHTHSFYSSMPYLRETPPNPAEAPLPSPHTFGMPTPPQVEQIMGHREASSYFSFREVPPPLPPLDHPAFRESTNVLGFSSTLSQHSKFARHSHSLPSLARARGHIRGGGIQRGTATRPRSKSIADTSKPVRKDTPAAVDAKQRSHSRSQSQSSVGSSRRSSADYSAKQASSLAGGCWEVDVSKAMIRLALVQGEVQGGGGSRTFARGTNTTSLSGKARGDNQLGARLGLGSPFFLQDTLAHKLSGRHLSNRAKPSPIFGSSNTGKTATRSSRDDIVMSHGESDTMTPAAGSRTIARSKEMLGSDTPSPQATRPRRGGRTNSTPSPVRTSSQAPKKLDTVPAVGSNQGSSSLLAPPTLALIGPTPEASPVSPTRRSHHKSSPTVPTRSALRPPSTPPVVEKSLSSGSSKRKAEEAGVGGDKTPPKEGKEHKTTFAPDPRIHRASGTSSLGHAPSSYHRSKRVRLSNGSDGSPPNAKNTGSWSSKGSHGVMSGSSHTPGPPVAPSASYAAQSQQQESLRASSRRSLSQASIPLSALVSPHAPSISHSGAFHMRDPRKPPPIRSTPWSLSFPSYVQEGESRWAFAGWVERGGSPLHAWIFFIGFIIFPLWWVAALFIPIPRTRRLGGTDAEKGVVLDDPQVEHDAHSWRTRCRVMAGVSFITYIPFIVLVAVFVS